MIRPIALLLARLHLHLPMPPLPPPRPNALDVLLAGLVVMLAVLALVFEVNGRERPALVVLWVAVVLYLLFNPTSPLGGQ